LVVVDRAAGLRADPVMAVVGVVGGAVGGAPAAAAVVLRACARAFFTRGVILGSLLLILRMSCAPV